MKERTKEPQYDCVVELDEKEGASRFGLMSNYVWKDDPKRIAFLLSRYKFVAKMLAGKRRALEVGCADGFGTRIVRQEVPEVTAVDFDPLFIADAKKKADERWSIDFRVHDLMTGPVEKGGFDAAFAVDVLEHIEEKDEGAFLGNMVESLTPEGFVIVGTPSLQSQAYASKASREGHVNCKTGETMRASLDPFFANVFIFSMNDEVVHTGYHAMAHYIWGVAATRRS